MVRCLSLLYLPGPRRLCVVERAVWSAVSLLYFHGPRRLCVVERAVWSAVYLYDVFMVLGGFVWWSD